MKILMLNLPFSGHTNPTLPLTEELVKRGHSVTYINAEEMRGRIEATGADFVPYRNYPARPDEAQKKKLCFRALFETAMALEEPYDLLIYEMFFYPGIEVAKRKGIPCVRQFSQSAWSEQTWREASHIFKLSAGLIDAQVFPKRLAGELGVEYNCLRDGVIKSRPKLNLVYLPESFQAARDSFDESYLFLVPEAKPMRAEIKIPYEEMKAPIVYISLGSIMSDKGFCRTCMKYFGDTEFSVILNTGKVPVESLGKLPENIHAYSFVPQVEVLSHTDVFLTHCGMNSINEALSLGVPMVAMPFINDQLTNAKQIVRCGLGLQVPSYPYRGRKMLEAVRQVHANPQFKQKVEEMRKKISSQISWEEVIKRIEGLLRC